MEHRSLKRWLFEQPGAALFCAIWFTALGWIIAVYCNAINPDSAGVKLAASILGPATGGTVAVWGALTVMRENGRRDTRRAAHLLRLKLDHLLHGFGVFSTDEATPEFIAAGLKANKAHWLETSDITDVGLHLAETLEGAETYQRIAIAVANLRILITISESAATDERREYVKDKTRTIHQSLREELENLDRMIERL